MDTIGDPSGGGDTADGWERPPEVTKWIDGLRDFARTAAMARRGPQRAGGRRIIQKEEAAALDVHESTYSRWCSTDSSPTIPSDRTVRKKLKDAGADSDTLLHLLSLRQAADDARQPGRRLRREHPDSGDSPARSGRADVELARETVVDNILREAHAESHGNPEHGRGQGMPASATHEQDTGELPPPNDNGRPVPPLPRQLPEAADALAAHLSDYWERVKAVRKLDLPPPLPVRWRRSQRSVTGRVQVAVSPQVRSRFSPLPGTPAATAEAVQAGDLDDLFDIYGGLGSGRIVLLGNSGSGKTGTAILMLVEALDRRLALPPDQRARTPVPVLLTAHGWDPRQQPLRDWFAAQLANTYTFLRADQYGPDAPDELVQNGAVALFLDGFDEMEPELQKAALQRIGREPRNFRLIVFTRTDEFVNTVQSGHLHGAVALELSRVTPDDAAQYLQFHQRDPLPEDDALQPLIDHLQHEPDSPVTQALDSPLTLTLVRDDPHAIEQLLQQDRFRDRSGVEDYLLGRVVPLAWGLDQPPGPDPKQAEQWLGYLASQMKANHHSDLAWWQMHHWMPARWRVLTNTVIGLITMGCVGALLFGPVGRYTVDGHTGTLFGVVYGASMGALFGAIAGLVSELREPHSNHTGRAWSAIRRASHHANPAIGLLIGVAVMMAVGNQSNYLFGVPAGLLAGYASARAANHVRLTTHPESPRWEILRPSRAEVLSALLAGVPIGLAYGVTKTVEHGAIAAVVATFVFGLMISVSRPLAGPDIATDPASSWHRDRRRGLLVGLTAGVPLALALGIKNGDAHGLLAGITAIIAHTLVITAGCMVGLCDSWRTTLLFGQLHRHKAFPLQGMQFLNDARNRGVLRTAGPYLQFKHARLRDILTNHSRTPS